MPDTATSPRAVLITGASTGIGKACALHLDRLGFRVFAAVRKPADGETLEAEASDRLQAVILDVTAPDTIEAARSQIEAAVGDQGLWGLVNNAGIAISGPLEFIPIDSLRRQIEVNLIGQIAVTQAFMPLIRKATGRVMFVGSMGGHIAAPLQGPYSATKFALEAISDSMRQELAPWGMHVVLIKPGSIATPIWDRGVQFATEVIERIPAHGLDLYRPYVEKLRTAVMAIAHRGIPAERVAEAVEHALKADVPKTRYLVGKDAQIGAIARFLPDRVRDGILRFALAREARTGERLGAAKPAGTV